MNKWIGCFEGLLPTFGSYLIMKADFSNVSFFGNLWNKEICGFVFSNYK